MHRVIQPAESLVGGELVDADKHPGAARRRDRRDRLKHRRLHHNGLPRSVLRGEFGTGQQPGQTYGVYPQFHVEPSGSLSEFLPRRQHFIR